LLSINSGSSLSTITPGFLQQAARASRPQMRSAAAVAKGGDDATGERDPLAFDAVV